MFNYCRICSTIAESIHIVYISMPHLISADVTASRCGLAILCKLDVPTCALMDSGNTQQTHLFISYLNAHPTFLILSYAQQRCTNQMLTTIGSWAIPPFLGWRCCNWMQLITWTIAIRCW